MYPQDSKKSDAAYLYFHLNHHQIHRNLKSMALEPQSDKKTPVKLSFDAKGL